MTAPAELLREYLQGQSDLGLDEIILPFPPPRAGHAAAAPSRRADPGGYPATERETSPMRAVSEPVGADAAAGEPASGYGMFASLSQALAGTGASRAAAGPEAAPKPRIESALPSFPGLDAFWAHLEANPGVAAGDPAALGVRIVKGHGPAGATLALVGLEPGEADAAAGKVFQGDAGALLDKLLKAIRLDPGACYKTSLVKAARTPKATRRDQARLLPWLHAELALADAPFVLLLGEACAQAVLKTGKPLDELRQEPFRIEGREFCATFHPAELLAREEWKRKAWEDLQWLQKRMAEGSGR